MSKSSISWRPLVAIVGCCVLGACATQQAPVAAATPPQISGAWYQVFFDSDKADINARGQVMIAKASDVVKRNRDVRVTVIGKTDRVGAAAANMSLSERRADGVRDALIASGVPSDRIDTSWVGEGKQDTPMPDNVAEQRGRVVDVLVQLPY